MTNAGLKITYVGGPTALVELSGLRFLTDPTFDAAGTEYPAGLYTLRKTAGPAVSPEQLEPLDAVLLSHDHHFDNLDNTGRAMLGRARTVLTTPAGAGRLSGSAQGLTPWQSIEISNPDGAVVRVTAVPARHGPADADRGPVTGFVLVAEDQPRQGVYVSGDTVWYESIAEIARRFPIRAALLFMGAARVGEVGSHHLTFTAAEAVQAARAFADATIIPLHFEGWAHYSESREDIASAFRDAGLEARLCWLEPGIATVIR